MKINSAYERQLSSSDFFFYYGEGNFNLQDESRHDLLELLLDGKRGMYFFRDFGCGVRDWQGQPVSLRMQIGLPFDVTNAIANRNGYVQDGSNPLYPDRRIATAQDAINYKVDDMGDIDISVYYFLFADYKQPNVIRFPLGRTQ